MVSFGLVGYRGRRFTGGFSCAVIGLLLFGGIVVVSACGVFWLVGSRDRGVVCLGYRVGLYICGFC